MINYTLSHREDSYVFSRWWRAARDQVPLVERQPCDVTFRLVSGASSDTNCDVDAHKETPQTLYVVMIVFEWK